jgi:uncharacterized membrane protein YcaP (DUF421 family)
MWQLGAPPLELVVRTIIVYLGFVVALRLFGKREVGQFTLFDLGLLLLAANALQPAITGRDTSVTGAAIIIATMFVLNAGVSQLRERLPFVRRLLESEPTVLAQDGAWIESAIQREGLDENDLDAALREHGVELVDEVKLAVLEQDGSISVVPAGGPHVGRRNSRFRYRRAR